MPPSLSEHLGQRVLALITDMDQPLGNAIGNALEVMEAFQRSADEGRRIAIESQIERPAREPCEPVVQSAAHADRAEHQLLHRAVVRLQAVDRQVAARQRVARELLFRAPHAFEQGNLALVVVIDADAEIDVAGARIRVERLRDAQDRVTGRHFNAREQGSAHCFESVVEEGGAANSVAVHGDVVAVAVEAADRLIEEDIDITVLDLRSIRPLDWISIEEAVKRTSKVLIVHEDNQFGGFGAEVSAQITEKALNWLDAPVRRYATPEIPTFPFSGKLEAMVMPSVDGIVQHARELAAY